MATGCAIAIICKTPRAGSGKSRLQPVLGLEGTAALSACFIRDVAAAIEVVPEAIGRSLYAIYAPVGTEATLRTLLPSQWGLVARQDGILGAVLGLIHVMENLAAPGKLGSGIAVAFVATVYGVGSANLLLLPLATKIRARAHAAALAREVIIEGISAIQLNQHPRLVEQHLSAFLRAKRELGQKAA